MDEHPDVDVSDEDRRFLAQGLGEWGGPARLTDDVARVIGFESREALFAAYHEIIEALRSGRSLSRRDWRRSLVATEIAFGSDVYGSGVEWGTTTGYRDGESIVRLRRLQRYLSRRATSTHRMLPR